MKHSWIAKTRLYGSVVVPSGLSLALASALAFITFFIYYLHIFLNYFEVNGSFRVNSFLSGRIHRILAWTFGTRAINSVVLIMFWAAVGLIIYVIGRSLAKDISELSLEVNERTRFLWPQNSKPKMLERFFETFLFSLAILVVLIIYCGRALSFFLRGRVLASPVFGPRTQLWLQNHTAINNAVFIISEIIALQVVVILLRLLFKRSRLFGR